MQHVGEQRHSNAQCSVEHCNHMSALGSVIIATVNTKTLSFGLLPCTIALFKKNNQIDL
jgi:hypothetical protein